MWYDGVPRQRWESYDNVNSFGKIKTYDYSLDMVVVPPGLPA